MPVRGCWVEWNSTSKDNESTVVVLLSLSLFFDVLFDRRFGHGTGGATEVSGLPEVLTPELLAEYGVLHLELS